MINMAVFLEVKRTIPCRAAPLHIIPGWFASQVFKRFCGKRTSNVPIRYALHPTPGCDTLQWGTVWIWYGSLWHALDHDGKWSAMAHFQTGSAWAGGGGGGGTHVYWWYGDVPLWRPPFSDPDCRSQDTRFSIICRSVDPRNDATQFKIRSRAP